MSASTRVAAFCLLVGICGCGVQHIRPHVAKHRKYDAGSYEAAPKPVSEGSTWQDGSRSLVADFRAGRVGDLVTIRVDESPKAQGDAETKLDRSSSTQIGASKMLGIAAAIQRSNPNVDMSALFDVMSKSSFDGSGATTRNSHVQAAMSARVRTLLPNGDLFIEGAKVLMVNDEELHIYVSGVVRPEDIEQDNSVASSLIADAQIEFTGRGALTDNQQQGWFSRFLSTINPF